jgi:PAS domain S-box-containing protein
VGDWTAGDEQVSTPWILAFRNRVVNISEGFTKFLGYTRDEVIGKEPRIYGR